MRRARRYCNARTTRMPAWVHNRFRDLDERWRSASTGRRNACPTYFAKRLIQQGGAGGFACRSHGHNQWSASKLNKFPKTVKRAPPEQIIRRESWARPGWTVHVSWSCQRRARSPTPKLRPWAASKEDLG